MILRKSSESVIKRDSTTQAQQYRSQPPPPLNSSQASQIHFQHSGMVNNGIHASVLQVTDSNSLIEVFYLVLVINHNLSRYRSIKRKPKVSLPVKAISLLRI